MEEEGEPLPLPAGTGAQGLGSAVARLLHRRLPALGWAARYSRDAALADLVAGVTLGLTLVPQSIAYAALANLPAQYGLYSSFVGTMLYTLLGTVKEVSIGPTSLMALLTLQTCGGLPVEYVVLLTFLSGCAVLAMALLRLGCLVDLLSPAVTSGFTSATAVIIIAAQLKGLLGLSFAAESVAENAAQVAARLSAGEARGADCALGAACCTALLLLRKLKDLPVHPKRRSLRKALWLTSIARNALVVCGAALAAYCTEDAALPRHPLFQLSGRVEPGLPPLQVPAFSVAEGNGTAGFVQMASRLGSGVVMLPVVMVLANIAIAKAFTEGGRVDASQEMLALGLCNVAGSLFHAMPTCGAFTRSAVSHASGVRTPAAGLYSGVITLLALVFMTQYFYYIPKACLSAVLICAVIFMVDVGTARRLWRDAPGELVVLALTFLVGVAHSVELALLCGALAGLARVLRALVRPGVRVCAVKTALGVGALLRPRRALLYLNAERFAASAREAAARVPGPVLVDCGELALLDYSAAQALARLAHALGPRLVLYNAAPGARRVLEALPGTDVRTLRAPSAPAALLALQPDAPPEVVPLLTATEPGTAHISSQL